MQRVVYFDTETSGLKPGNIGQLSVIVEDDKGVRGINYFFEIDHVDADVTQKLGRDVQFYKDRANGVRFKDKAEEIQNLFNNSIYTAHNLKFDENFLSSELWRCNLVAQPASRFDTMQFYKDIIKATNMYGRIKNPKLIEVVQGLGLNEEKIRKYAIQLFGDDETIDYHDSRYDTTVVFVLVQIARDFKAMNNVNIHESKWVKTFT